MPEPIEPGSLILDKLNGKRKSLEWMHMGFIILLMALFITIVMSFVPDYKITRMEAAANVLFSGLLIMVMFFQYQIMENQWKIMSEQAKINTAEYYQSQLTDFLAYLYMFNKIISRREFSGKIKVLDIIFMEKCGIMDYLFYESIIPVYRLFGEEYKDMINQVIIYLIAYLSGRVKDEDVNYILRLQNTLIHSVEKYVKYPELSRKKAEVCFQNITTSY